MCVVVVWRMTVWPVSWTRLNMVSPLACAASSSPSCLGVADHAHFNHRAASSNLPGDGSQLHAYNFLPGVQEERWVCRDWGVSGMGPQRLERRCLSLMLPLRNYMLASFLWQSKMIYWANYLSSLLSAQFKYWSFSKVKIQVKVVATQRIKLQWSFGAYVWF